MKRKNAAFCKQNRMVTELKTIIALRLYEKWMSNMENKTLKKLHSSTEVSIQCCDMIAYDRGVSVRNAYASWFWQREENKKQKRDSKSEKEQERTREQ